MKKMYVYLVKNKKTLVISNKEIAHIDYTYLMDNEGNNEELQMKICKMFCIGFISGNQTDIKIVSEMQEFV